MDPLCTATTISEIARFAAPFSDNSGAYTAISSNHEGYPIVAFFNNFETKGALGYTRCLSNSCDQHSTYLVLNSPVPSILSTGRYPGVAACNICGNPVFSFYQVVPIQVGNSTIDVGKLKVCCLDHSQTTVIPYYLSRLTILLALLCSLLIVEMLSAALRT